LDVLRRPDDARRLVIGRSARLDPTWLSSDASEWPTAVAHRFAAATVAGEALRAYGGIAATEIVADPRLAVIGDVVAVPPALRDQRAVAPRRGVRNHRDQRSTESASRRAWPLADLAVQRYPEAARAVVRHPLVAELGSTVPFVPTPDLAYPSPWPWLELAGATVAHAAVATDDTAAVFAVRDVAVGHLVSANGVSVAHAAVHASDVAARELFGRPTTVPNDAIAALRTPDGTTVAHVAARMYRPSLLVNPSLALLQDGHGVTVLEYALRYPAFVAAVVQRPETLEWRFPDGRSLASLIEDRWGPVPSLRSPLAQRPSPSHAVDAGPARRRL
jgi:hypothetical protein